MELKDERPIVVGIGEVVIDHYSSDNSEKLGGAPLIFAYHAAKTHCKGIIVSAIGLEDKDRIDEKENTMIDELNRLNLWGNSKDYIYKVPNRQSGFVEVNDSDKNNPLYNIKTDAAWVDIPWMDNLKQLAKKTAAVYYGSLASFCGESQKGASKQTIDTFIDNVPHSCFKIFDINLRNNPDKNRKHKKELYNEKLIREYLDKCNVLKANKVEMGYLARNVYGIVKPNEKAEIDRLCEILMKKYCPQVKILILTKGKEGSTIYWREKKKLFSQSIHISVKPKNTVGAGDAMAGTFIGELLNGKTIREAHYLAALRSDTVCRERKSMPGFKANDLFFSYSNKDSLVVKWFYDKINQNKEYTVFKDSPDINPGEKLGNVIAEAIENCQVFTYFSSKNASTSKNVILEIKKAIRAKKRIIIIKLDDTPYPKQLYKDLEQVHYECFYWYKQDEYLKLDKDRNLDDVVNRIIGFLKQM